MELEWPKKNLSFSDALEMSKMVDHRHPQLSVSRQCALLGLPRSMLYYQPTLMRDSTVRVMARLDAHHLEDHGSGSRRLVVWISAGILGFQGGTLALDLINCTVPVLALGGTPRAGAGGAASGGQGHSGDSSRVRSVSNAGTHWGGRTSPTRGRGAARER